MNFMSYDIGLLIIFVICISIFLYVKRKRLKKEGLLLLYRTSWGVRLINQIGKKYKGLLTKLSYVSVGLGYVLMAGMLYLVGKIVWVYVFNPEIVRAIKVPPIMPLIPYLPQIFQLDFLPPFYFTYWIIIIAIIAITHEFAHGIFAARNKIRIKTTGFGFFPFFLPVFLAAFVELDEKRMAKKKKFDQLAILSAGTFANVLTAILFFGILVLFFSVAFTPAGIMFDNYPYSPVNINDIQMVNGVSLVSPTYEQILNSIDEEELNSFQVGNMSFLGTKSLIEEQKDQEYLVLYYDAPAINAKLESVILKINNQEILNIDNLKTELIKFSPGEKITLTVLGDDDEPYNKDLILGEHPDNKSVAWLGIAFSQQKGSGIIGRIYSTLGSFRKPNIYYKPKFDGISTFVYHLLWWIILISISVALINMLPVGIFDGGKFFYLTMLGITKKEESARKIFKFVTYLFLFLLFLLMIFWFISFR